MKEIHVIELHSPNKNIKVKVLKSGGERLEFDSYENAQRFIVLNNHRMRKSSLEKIVIARRLKRKED